MDFVDQLVIALEFSGFSPTIDRHGISGGEDWKRRLGSLICETDSVVFVLSPASSCSEICEWEAREAAKLGKRIIPVLSCSLEGTTPPQVLSDLNYIYFYRDPKSPGSGFAAGLKNLRDALNSDFEWHREHTRILQRAIEWESGGRQAMRLLSGSDIEAAKGWSARRPRTAPELTELQLAFIRASETEADMRNSAERRRLAEIAAAQDARADALGEAEAALKQAAEAQRRRSVLRNMLLLALTLIAGISLWSFYKITQGNRQLAAQVDFANAAASRAQSAEARARSDQQRAQAAEFNAIVNECTASKLLFVATPNDADALDNYLSCNIRLGFALIREGRLQEAEAVLDQTSKSSNVSGIDPTYSFYLSLATQGAAVASCAMTEPKSIARFEAIDRLIDASNNVRNFEISSWSGQRRQRELEARWREEVVRGAIYISDCSHGGGKDELAFDYSSSVVDTLVKVPVDNSESARALARALDHLAWMAVIMKRAREALDASERAVKLVRDFGIKDIDSVRLNYAHALLINGRSEDAQKEYQKLNPDAVLADVEALMSAGICNSLLDELTKVHHQCH